MSDSLTKYLKVACPLIYGSISYWMGKKADEYATHKWTCKCSPPSPLILSREELVFVRGPNDEDLSVFISKIIFSLHPSFANPLRGISLHHLCSDDLTLFHIKNLS
jgi:YEATS domain-containing protein 4